MVSAESGKSRLSFWRVDNASAEPGVFKPKPEIGPLTSAPPQPIRLALGADSAIRCDGYWQGEPALRSLGWIIGTEVYAAYQDPSEVVCVNTYPFTVTDVFWILQVDVGMQLRMQPVLATVSGTPECPMPGDLLCLGPLDSLYFDPGTWMVQMPFDSACTVDGAYYACVFLPDAIPSGGVDLIFDADTANPIPCRSYDDWGDGWQDMSAQFPNMILWSEGLTAAAPACACDCHGDPVCDGVINIHDVVTAINVAFRSFPVEADGNAQCPFGRTDITCDGLTNIADVVKFANIAFRGFTVDEICVPCP